PLGRRPHSATATAPVWRGRTVIRTASSGEALDLITAPEKTLARQVRGRRIGLTPHSPAAPLTPVRTARAHLAEALRELGRTETPDALAARAGLRPEDLDRYPHQLSGGMAQRE